MLKSLAKKYLPATIVKVLRGYSFKMRYARQSLFAKLQPGNLARLAVIFQAVKPPHYMGLYSEHFARLRKRKLNILEIGIGGRGSSEAGGGSLRMWKEYFSNAKIFGIDIIDKSFHNQGRIKTFFGNQSDKDFLKAIIAKIGDLDIVIDDGSHRSPDVLASFNVLFPSLSKEGIYVIEDVQTSYRKEWEGSSGNLSSHETTMGFLKSLCDSMNYKGFQDGDVPLKDFSKQIKAIHFYTNIVFIEKGSNIYNLWEAPSK